jgi:uncharacterized membrane protein
MPSAATINERRALPLLLLLLLLYLTGRVLQLFAGRIPDLLIVVLQVIPSALFALIHGARAYRASGILVFTGLCLGVGTFFETVSLRTGFPFGHYQFTSLMGPRLFGLPALLALAYLGVGYLSWVVALVMLGYQNAPVWGPVWGRRIVLLPVVASFVMVAWDFSMDPVWAYIDHAWVWRDGGGYYGVPVSNFFGWFLTVYIFYQLFALYLRRREILSAPPSHFRLALMFYAACALGNLLVAAPASPGAFFVDASGRQWRIADVLWASRLVSIFVMLPFVLIGWARAPDPADVQNDAPRI